ncbi:MAG: LytTR family transcriptional regulator DNA-binding domain-containing protein, partial [Lentimicrobiaceae bacterium]|nr:LytTR family transcriptional regulator DNA-binding domain-containing protein [Lentimicrobiaceae bacterium]
MNKNKLTYFIGHIIFCLLLFYWFYYNSVLRPACMTALYKEIISAALVLLLIYVNYFIVVPKLLMKNLYIKYIILSIVLLFLCGIIELYMVESNIAICIKHAFPDENTYRLYLRSLLLLLILRDGGFYFFFTLLSLYRNQLANTFKKESTLLQENETKVFMQTNGVSISFNTNKIVYFEQNKNKTTFYSTYGSRHTIYSSLSDQKLFFGDRCLKINRNTLVFYDKIVSFSQEYLTVKDSKNGGITPLYFFKNNPLTVYNTLQKKVPLLEQKEKNITPKKDTFGGLNDQKQ